MKLHLALAAVAAITSASFVVTTADAAEPVVAKLQSAVPEKTKIVAGGAVWVCEGGECVAGAPSSRTLATASCKELVKNVGAVETYGDAKKQLAADKLETCNAAAPQTLIANR